MGDDQATDQGARRSGRVFLNRGPYAGHGFSDFLRWRMGRGNRPRWPSRVENPAVDVPPERVEGGALRVSYVGHVSLLLQTQGLNILTDPVWSQRASPLSFAGPRRCREPGLPLEALPPIDIVLVSHNHYDHLDVPTLRALHRDHAPRFIVPLENDHVLRRNGLSRIETLDWGQWTDASADMRIHCEPTHHWSARGLFDRNKALWASFVLTTPKGNILFVGDSGYAGGDLFRAHRRKFGGFRIAFLPIGAYGPRWFMQENHMNPDEACRAFHDCGAEVALATHYEVFPLADDGFDAPRAALTRARPDYQISPDDFRMMQPGQSWTLPVPDDIQDV